MKKNLINISGKIESIRLAAIEEIANIADSEDIPFFIVGATARDLILSKGHDIRPSRATLDIDIGVRVQDWHQFKNLKSSLIETNNFKEAKEFQRLIFREEINIDLIPFGPITDKDGEIKWPPDEEVAMSIIGFEEAYSNSQTIRLRDDPILDVKVVTLAGLAIMKILSWKDGFPNRRKDAGDLALIMNNYTAAGNEERIINEHSDLLDSEDFDFLSSGVRLLGRDIATILTGDLKDKVLDVLKFETDAERHSKLAEDMLTNNIIIKANFKMMLDFLKEMKKGILERL